MNGPTHTVGSHSDDRGGESDWPCYCDQNVAPSNSKSEDTSLDDLLDLYTYEITKRGSDGDSSRKAIKAWHTTQQKALLKRVREEVIGKTPKRSDDPQQLDELIDIESKQFMRWSQKDIAHFFERVGAMYRNLSNQLKEGGEK